MMATGVQSIAQAMVAQIVAKLEEISTTLGRQLELQQAPRLNFLAAGSIAGSGTATQNTSGNRIIPPNPHRRGLNVQNTTAAGGGSLTIGLGVDAPIAGQGIVLVPGASWDGRVSGAIWTGSVSVVANTAGVTYSWLIVQGPSSQHRNEVVP